MENNKLSVADLIAEVSAQAGITQKDTRLVIDELARAIGRFTAAGVTVTVPNIVRLTPKFRAARVCRNPQTGGSVESAARVVVKASIVAALARTVAGE